MSANQKNSLFSFFYRSRITVTKNTTPIVNLSLLFSLLALLTAPWLVVCGAVIALALGYKFSLQRNAAEFTGSFDQMVKDAPGNMRSAVSGMTAEAQQ